MSRVPAFTVIEEVGQNNYQDNLLVDEPAPWQSMYQSNVMSAPPNSPFSDYNVPHVDADYETLTYSAKIPQVAPSYNQSLFNNAAVSMKNLRYNLPANAPLPLPVPLDLPMTATPYGTPYPTNGYSADDGALAMDSGISQFYALPGVPAASWPSLEDARKSPSVPAGPATIAIVAEQHFKEGFKKGLEHLSQPTCSSSIEHVNNCPICNHFVNGDKKYYKIAIIFLTILAIVLLWIIYKRSHVKH